MKHKCYVSRTTDCFVDNILFSPQQPTFSPLECSPKAQHFNSSRTKQLQATFIDPLFYATFRVWFALLNTEQILGEALQAVRNEKAVETRDWLTGSFAACLCRPLRANAHPILSSVKHK